MQLHQHRNSRITLTTIIGALLTMKHDAIKSFFCCLLLGVLLVGNGYADTAKTTSLKQTMKQMQLQYKEALDSQSAESFNKSVATFKLYLSQAQSYKFSPERKAVSLEGLSKVESFIAEIPAATDDNLAELQTRLASIDKVRKEYHKKAKPGVWGLLFSLFE